MSRAARFALVRVGLVLVVATGGFFVLQAPVRTAEAHAAAWLLHTAGADGVTVLFGTSIQVFPPAHDAFRAVVTRSCSSLPALLAVCCLALLTPPGRPGRRTAALLAALATVATGNVLRIAASIAVGLVAGRASLVLFHDWVGTIFSFAYTLGGYVLMLHLLLPRIPRTSAPTYGLAA